jgi:hypothetical protein
MNTELFIKIANNLLTIHYGIGTHDTGIDERSIVECIKNNIRPYEEVNTLAREYGLNRIGVNYMIPDASHTPLTLDDEYRAISEETTGQLLGEDILNCFACGARTDFVCLESGEQHHTCLNSHCGHEFMAE